MAPGFLVFRLIAPFCLVCFCLCRLSATFTEAGRTPHSGGSQYLEQLAGRMATGHHLVFCYVSLELWQLVPTVQWCCERSLWRHISVASIYHLQYMRAAWCCACMLGLCLSVTDFRRWSSGLVWLVAGNCTVTWHSLLAQSQLLFISGRDQCVGWTLPPWSLLGGPIVQQGCGVPRLLSSQGCFTLILHCSVLL